MSPIVFCDVIRVADALLLSVVAVALTRRLVAQSVQAAEYGTQTLLCMIAGALAAGLLCTSRQYEVDRLRRPSKFLPTVMITVLVACGGAFCIGCLVASLPPDITLWLGGWLLCSLLLISVLHASLVPTMNEWCSSGRLARTVAIVGVNDVSRRFIENVRGSGTGNIRLFGVYREAPTRSPFLHAGLLVRGHVMDLVHEIRCGRIDTVVLAITLSSGVSFERILEELAGYAVRVQVLSELPIRHPLPELSDLEPGPLVTIAEPPMQDWRALRKRMFDVVGAAVLLLLLAPLLFVIAVMIRRESPGPALFRQQRTGFRNTTFTIYKFRTMYQELCDPQCNAQTTRDDPRVTRLGKWLRRSSIDELPQLMNVLKGDMSLVGPRPHAPKTSAGTKPFDAVVARYAHRHRVKPGITGWAQVNGFRGEIRTDDDIRRRVELDLYYIRNWSLIFDLRILALTLLKEMYNGRGY